MYIYTSDRLYFHFVFSRSSTALRHNFVSSKSVRIIIAIWTDVAVKVLTRHRRAARDRRNINVRRLFLPWPTSPRAGIAKKKYVFRARAVIKRCCVLSAATVMPLTSKVLVVFSFSVFLLLLFQLSRGRK